MSATSLTSPMPLTDQAFRALASARLHAAPPLAAGDAASVWHRGPSDFDLNPDAVAEMLAGSMKPPAARPAAVLVPAIRRDEISLLFTRRTDHLPAHAGQIAFPGGKAEPQDAGPADTALREAREEIGLDPLLVEPIGYLDCYRTGTGFCITPVVALVDPSFTVRPDPNEVQEIFEVPLRFLMDPGNHQEHVRTIGGRERRFYAMAYGERFIWGATAGILKNMHERLFGP